jgi:uncharacterized protein YndB with AHSA1/START domain
MEKNERNTGTAAILKGTTSRSGTMHIGLGKDVRDVIFSRKLNAPRERVFPAWTTPNLMSQWWGPNGYTNPVCQMDARPGGSYRIIMRSPEGVEYPNSGTYLEVTAPERIIYTDTFDEMPTEWLNVLKKKYPEGVTKFPDQLLMTIGFEAIETETKLTIQTHFDSVFDRDALLKMGTAEGWAQSLDRLERLLTRS